MKISLLFHRANNTQIPIWNYNWVRHLHNDGGFVSIIFLSPQPTNEIIVGWDEQGESQQKSLNCGKFRRLSRRCTPSHKGSFVSIL